MLAELLIGQALLFGLVFTRMVGFLITSPFPAGEMPKTTKVGAALALTLFTISTIPKTPELVQTLSASVNSLPLERLVGPLLTELFLGASVGFVSRIVLSAGDIAGELVGQMTGLGSASLFNPLLGTQDTVVSRIFTLLAMMLLIGAGIHREILAYLVQSFQAVPIGSGFTPGDAMPVVLDAIVGSVALGVRLAMPVVAVALVLQAALAIVARMAPSLQVFNVGFPMLIGVGLVTVMFSLHDVSLVLADHLRTIGPTIERFFYESVH